MILKYFKIICQAWKTVLVERRFHFFGFVIINRTFSEKQRTYIFIYAPQCKYLLPTYMMRLCYALNERRYVGSRWRRGALWFKWNICMTIIWCHQIPWSYLWGMYKKSMRLNMLFFNSRKKEKMATNLKKNFYSRKIYTT